MVGETCDRGVANCQQFWRDSRGLCLACGKEPPLPHQHRFPRYVAGDTMPVCEDCRLTVVITPEEAAKLAGVTVSAPPAITMPELIFAATRGKFMPSYIQIAKKYNRMMRGSYDVKPV